MLSYCGHLLWVGFVNKEQGRYLFVKNIERYTFVPISTSTNIL